MTEESNNNKINLENLDIKKYLAWLKGQYQIFRIVPKLPFIKHKIGELKKEQANVKADFKANPSVSLQVDLDDLNERISRLEMEAAKIDVFLQILHHTEGTDYLFNTSEGDPTIEEFLNVDYLDIKYNEVSEASINEVLGALERSATDRLDDLLRVLRFRYQSSPLSPEEFIRLELNNTAPKINIELFQRIKEGRFLFLTGEFPNSVFFFNATNLVYIQELNNCINDRKKINEFLVQTEPITQNLSPSLVFNTLSKD